MEIFKETIGIRKKKDRPYGELSSKGKYSEMLIDAKKIASELSMEMGVLGITISGGISRGYADDFSEIDLNIYLEEDVYNNWILGMGPVPHGDALWKGKYVDLDFLSLKKEIEEEWSLIKKWDASYNKILFDPEGKIEQLFNKKDIFSSREKFECVSEYFEKCMYIGNLVVLQWISRGDPLAANQLINNAISSLISMVFFANDEYPPYEKWALNYSYSLKWLPNQWKIRLSDIIITKEISIEEAKRRHILFIELYKECWEKIFGKELRDLEFIDIITLKELQYIIDNSPVLIDKFAESFNIKHLSYEPIYKFTNILIKDDKKYIHFDKDKFNNRKSKNFPNILDWSKEMLNKLKLN
ncbi:MAG: DUF4037 domain-containing protein [Promethearchaeota archaeon]